MTVILQEVAFDPGVLLAFFSRGRTETGAIVSFSGIARAGEGKTDVLELEAYPGFTEAEIGPHVRATCAEHHRGPATFTKNHQAIIEELGAMHGTAVDLR